MSVYRYEELTAEEIIKLANNGKCIGIINIGSLEQHGKHLPVGTDYILGDAFLNGALKKVKTNADIVVIPQFPVACSIEHINVGGTITFTPSFVIEMLKQVGRCLKKAGINTVVIVSGHGGNEHEMEIAAREMRIDGMNSFCIHNFLAEAKYGAKNNDVHAGHLETSVMMKLRPDLVHIERANENASKSENVWDNLTNSTTCASQAWIATDLSSEGICGNPFTASEEDGEKWLEIMPVEIANAIDAIAQKVFTF